MYACVVVGTDLVGTVEVVNLRRKDAEDHSGIGVKRLEHQEVGTAGEVRKADYWDIEIFQEVGISATVVGTTVAAAGRVRGIDRMIVGMKSMLN